MAHHRSTQVALQRQAFHATSLFTCLSPLLGCRSVSTKQKSPAESIVIIGIYHNCQSSCVGKTHLSCLNELSLHADLKLPLGNQLQGNESLHGVT